jgi:hypothetical protein
VSERSAEDLRREAVEALGDHADERAREVLSHATVAVEEGVARWHSSAGVVQAHRVTLGLDARTLGGLRALPSLVDALAAAFAGAIARQPLESLHDLTLRWTPGARPVAAGYRDAPPPAAEESLGEAVMAYLEGSGEGELARSLAPLDVDASSAPDVVVHAARPDTLRDDAHARHMLTSALRDLIGVAGARVRVR